MMKGKEVKKSRICLLIEGALCLAVPAMLAAAALSIYREGIAVRKSGDALAWIYTRETVSAKFAPIAPWVLLMAVLAVVGIILRIDEWELGKPAKEYTFQKELLRKKIRMPSPEMRHEQKLQRVFRAAGAILFAACMIPILRYLMDTAHFPEDELEWMFSSLLQVLLPWTFLGLLILYLCSVLTARSEAREVGAARVRMKEEREAGGQAAFDTADTVGSVVSARERRPVPVRAIVFIAAVCMIIAGVMNGGIKDVLVKAINLCTECVGLG